MYNTECEPSLSLAACFAQKRNRELSAGPALVDDGSFPPLAVLLTTVCCLMGAKGHLLMNTHSRVTKLLSFR